MKILLESSAIIEYLKGNIYVREILEKAEDFYVSSLSVFEVLLGKVKEDEILDFLSSFKIVSFTKKDSILASKIYKKLKEKGKLIGIVDILISSQALNRELTLVSKDTDFLKIKEEFTDFKILYIK
jgi:predicted nucleic acid-binding protein